MTRDEFIELLKENIKPNAQIDFLICDHEKPIIAFLEIDNVCMNVDVDPSCHNRGGVIFAIKKDLI